MASREETCRGHRERVLRAMVYVQSNLTTTGAGADLSLERLARLAHMSPFHFQRVFAAESGEGPAAFVRRLRLESAARALRYTDRAVEAVGAEVGYAHRESFVRAFGAHFGVGPAAYRRQALGARPGESGSGSGSASRGGGVRVDNFPALHLAFVRRIGGDGVPFDRFPALVAWAAARQRAGPEDLLRLGVIHDDPRVTARARRRFDACVAVAPSVRPEGDIGIQVIGGGEYGVATHRGSYAGLARTRERVALRCVRVLRRRLRAAPVIEVYLNGPARAGGRRLLTDVLVPVETVRATRRWYFRRARP